MTTYCFLWLVVDECLLLIISCLVLISNATFHLCCFFPHSWNRWRRESGSGKAGVMTNSIVWMLLRLSPPQKLSTMSRSTEWFMNLLNILPGTLDMQFEHLQSAQFPLSLRQRPRLVENTFSRLITEAKSARLHLGDSLGLFAFSSCQLSGREGRREGSGLVIAELQCKLPRSRTGWVDGESKLLDKSWNQLDLSSSFSLFSW